MLFNHDTQLINNMDLDGRGGAGSVVESPSTAVAEDTEAINPVMNTYGRFPLTLVKGSGSYVWDDQGKQYLDFTSGIATCNLGHTPDKVKQKVKAQLDELWHCSNLYHIPNQQQLAKALVQHTFADQVFFCNSGAEANEGAIKLAKKYATDVKGMTGDQQAEIVTFAQSFHGRTMATLSATGQEKIQQGFGPLVKGFRYLPYNDVAALDDLVQEQTVAVLLELVQGEGGIVPADAEWIKKLEVLCQQNDILLMVDEIQTGMGRTGTLFAYEQYGIEPDVMTVAKGLGSGIPIGALLAKEKVSRVLQPGTHGSTFGGNPLATAAGLATLEIISDPEFIKQVQDKGELFHQQLTKLQAEYSSIEAVRGKGLLLGLYMPEHAAKLVEKLRDEHILVLLAGPQVVRILPPLNVSEEEISQFITICSKVLSQLSS